MEEIRFGSKHQQYYEFSNFYNAMARFEGVMYPYSECAFQAAKTLDLNKRQDFRLMTARESKKAGRALALRPDWESVKVDVMYQVVMSKFTLNQKLMEKLLSTGDAVLIEDTTGWHDNIWGDCRCPKCIGIRGQNLLGTVLMKVRSDIRQMLARGINPTL